MKKYIFIVCFIFQSLNAEQFMYPVADFDDGNIMILYQKSLNEIELYFWNPSTQHALKGLSSFLIPANLRVMPSGKGFSFIDQGFIKIKEFSKRSPRTISIYEPIGLFSSMNWIDDENFYFVAREGNLFQIFKSDLQGNIYHVTNDLADALYPQKIDNTLFYIRRDMEDQIAIVAQEWNPVSIHTYKDFSDKITLLTPETNEQLCYLHMVSDQEGFYLKAPFDRTQNDNGCYEFSCYHLEKKEKEWSSEKIFNFKVIAKYLIGNTRLYESLECFLPNYTTKDIIYFTDWNLESSQFDLFSYNIIEKNIEKISQDIEYRYNKEQIFSPYVVQGKVFCGLITQEKKFLKNLFQADDIYFNLPFFIEKNKS